MENETNHRSKEKCYQCDICNRFYATPATLKVHRLQHTSKKTELCDFCSASFKTRGQLKIHRRVHTGEKPYKCDKCDKAFAYRESLITHYTTHTNVKPFVCGACDAQFSCIGNLLKHRKLRPDKCGLANVPIKRVGPRLNRKTLPNLTDKCPKQIEYEEGSRPTETTGPDEIEALEYSGIKEEQQDEAKTSTPAVFESSHKCIRLSIEALQSSPMVCERLTSSIDNDVENLSNNKNDLNQTNETIRIGNYALQSTTGNESQEDAVSEEADLLVEVITHPSVYRISYGDGSKSDPLITPSDDNDYESDQLEASFERNSLDERDDESWHGESDHSSNSCNNESIDSPIRSSEHQKQHQSQKELLSTIKLEMEQSELESDKEDKELLKEQLKLLHDLSNYTDERYRCKLCPQQFITHYLMARHLEKAHNVKQDRVRAKLQYMRNTTKNPTKYRCKFCEQTYVNRSSLFKHLQKHGQDGRLAQKCPCCERYFVANEEITQHILEQHRERVECTVCQKQFTKPDSLKRHIRYAHKGNVRTKHICPQCGKSFPSATSLSDHERAKCGTEPIYKCEKCKKHYSSYSSLKMHRSVHENVLPFECSFCGKKFRTKGQLKVHGRAHTGERPFRCEVCSRSFPYRESLITHRTIHTGVTQHECTECGRKFSCFGNLKKHRQIYHSEMGKRKARDESNDD